jgi:hypothetical protein
MNIIQESYKNWNLYCNGCNIVTLEGEKFPAIDHCLIMGQCAILDPFLSFGKIECRKQPTEK